MNDQPDAGRPGNETRAELSDGRARIRRYRAGDVDALFEAAAESIAEVYPWLPWCRPGYTRDESAEWVGARDEAWETAAAYSFVIEEVETREFIGGCGINQIDWVHLRANLGYWVRTSLAGRGFATAAALLCARFSFEDLRLQRVEIVAAVDNGASRRVAEKIGAKREGILRRRLLLHGKAHDAVSYSLVREDLAL